MTDIKRCICGAAMIKEMLFNSDGNSFLVYKCINCHREAVDNE